MPRNLPTLIVPEAANVPASNVTAADWTGLRGRVDPGAAGAAGEQLVQTVNGPKFIRGTLSPLMFGAVGDGVADDYAAIMATVAALGTAGGTIDVADKMFYSASSILVDTPVYFTSGQSGRTGGFYFPYGSDGIIFQQNTMSGGGVGPIKVYTKTYANTTVAAGTGTGVTVATASLRIDRTDVRGFGLDGIALLSNPTVAGANTNFIHLYQPTAAHNGRHGIYMKGSDSNACVLIGINVTQNRGWGVRNESMYHNTFITPHALSNMVGDYYDQSFSPMWLNPYSEGSGKFEIGNSSSKGTIIMGGPGTPSIWSNGVNNASFASSLEWVIIHNGRMLTAFRQQGAVVADTWKWTADNPSAGALTLRADSISRDMVTYGKGAGSGSITYKSATMGFFSKSAVSQPAANPDTAGATLAALETEVNELKAALRSLGLIAT